MKQILSLLLFTASLTACQESFDDRLQRESREFTANQCPLDVEPGTRLDSVTYQPAIQTYTSWYSLSSEYAAALQGNTPLLRRSLLDRLRSDTDHKVLKDHGLTFRYVYRAQASGQILCSIDLTTRDYQ